MALLDIRNLTIELSTPQGMAKVVDKVSLTMNDGEIRGLVGESGSGKSLIAKTIMGVTKDNWRITADRMRLDEVDLLTLSAKERRKVIGDKISMIFQEATSCLDPSLEIGRQLEAAIPSRAREKGFWHRFQWRKKQAIALLHKVGVKDHRRIMHSYPYELSEGLCQKVMIAMALAGRPKLLIADEPTASMEAITRSQILRVLDRLNKLNNTAILLISHDLHSIGHLADQITVLYCGQTVEIGSREQVFDDPKHPYTEALLMSVPDFSLELPHKSRLKTLPGSIPLLQHLPIGCRLGPRCPRAQKECVIAPPLVKIKGHQYACHFPITQDEDAE